MELKIGEMTNSELAEWFSIKEDTFRKRKSYYLKRLEEFCEFTPYRGYVEITEIKSSYYSKNPSYDFIKSKFFCEWGLDNEEGLDTCTHVGTKIWRKYGDEELRGMSKETCIYYTRKIKVEYFGHNDQGDIGLFGVSYSKFCIKKDGGEIIPLQPEQEIVRKQITKDAYDNDENYSKVMIEFSSIYQGDILVKATGFELVKAFAN